jgi:3-phenylpropionate/trans-cinnamate dioxygenase ferredoxin reductase component
MSATAVDHPPDIRRIVIVGAGHGGGTAAAVLRQQGFQGELIVFGSEPVGPYHRPPLSKSLLEGELEQPLAPRDFYREQRIDLRVSTRVEAIDREARAVQLRGGEMVGFDVLILATGAKARRLAIPGIDLERVYELRTITHARVLYDVLSPGSSLAIVGGGWIGLEVAASARAAGIDVTVIEREERLLARVASPELSRFLTDYHVARGTKILTSAQVNELRPGTRGRVASVVLDDARELKTDRVLVGVGAVAEDELASEAGLPCQDGVIVDANARTEDPRIYAVGDMTRRPIHFYDGMFRLESIPSAVEQARRAVASILAKPPPPPEVPWFWSDQFDLKLQIAGLLLDADTSVVRGHIADRSLAIFHLKDSRLVAMEGINAPAEFMASKQFIRARVKLDPDRLANMSMQLPETSATAALVEEEREPASATSGMTELPGPGGKRGQPRATYVQADGKVLAVDIAVGMTLMEGSVRNNLPGIIAECGGTCSCGTCHVYVDEHWRDRLDEPAFEEEDLLEFIKGRRPNSRLSCQIVMSDELDGLVVRIPDVMG